MNFHEKFVFNDFFTINWNIMKPTWYTLIHWKLSNNTKNMTKHTMVWEISMWQTNQINYLFS
jgi:hypothetical protein